MGSFNKFSGESIKALWNEYAVHRRWLCNGQHGGTWRPPTSVSLSWMEIGYMKDWAKQCLFSALFAIKYSHKKWSTGLCCRTKKQFISNMIWNTDHIIIFLYIQWTLALEERSETHTVISGFMQRQNSKLDFYKCCVFFTLWTVSLLYTIFMVWGGRYPSFFSQS